MIPARSEPAFFGPEHRPLFGWFHGTERASDVGVVVCNPFGYEQICAHRSLRHFAEAAARAGVPALRFDYDGTGDSSGDDFDPDRVALWVDSVREAIAFLRARAGVRRIYLVGVRLGAALATLAATAIGGVEGLLLVAPVTSGRAYVRELKLLQAALGLTEAPADAPRHDGVTEALGFALTEPTRAAMSAIALEKLDARPAERVAIFDRDDMAPSEALAERLEALGATVVRRSMPGYVEMVLDPHKSVVPAEMIRAFVEWLPGREDRGEAGTVSSAATQPTRSTPRVVAVGVRETPVWLGDGRGTFGVLSEPTGASKATRGGLGIVLVNAGAVHRVGPNRMYVALARRWARAGHRVLRIDVTGIGDTAAKPGEAENDVYVRHAGDDVAAAARALREAGAGSIRVGGICSGAYNAFRAAVDGRDVDGIFAINAATFAWKAGMRLDLDRPSDGVVASESARYRKSALSPEKWKKLLRGDVRLVPLARIVARAALARGRDRVVEAARRAGLRLPSDLGSELAMAAERGVALYFLFATGEPGHLLLESKAGSALPGLVSARKLELAVVDGPDHTFTALWSQARLAEVLDDHFAAVAADLASERRSSQGAVNAK